MKITVVKFGLLAGCLMLAGATHALAQEKKMKLSKCRPDRGLGRMRPGHLQRRRLADFCKNVTLGAFTSCRTYLRRQPLELRTRLELRT